MSAPRSILILRFSSLGDIILTTPLLDALNKNWPDAAVFLAVKKRYAGLFTHDPRLARVLAFDDTHAHRGWAGFWRYIKAARQQRFDIVIDVHATLRSRLVGFFLRKGQLVRYKKDTWQRRRMVRTKERDGSRHTVDKYLAVLPVLGLPPAHVRVPALIIPAEQQHWAMEFLRNQLTKGKLVGINAGARWPTKNWGAERQRALAGRLLPDHDVIIFGDKPEVAEWPALPAAIINTVGKLTLEQLAALLQKCDVLVTADSGPMHMATAVGVPVVALFGPTHPCLGFAPLGGRDVVVCKNTECSPCSLHGKKPCARAERVCLDSITVEEVYAAVDVVLEKKLHHRDTETQRMNGAGN
jgi:heptosyltransferase-2